MNCLPGCIKIAPRSPYCCMSVNYRSLNGSIRIGSNPEQINDNDDSLDRWWFAALCCQSDASWQTSAAATRGFGCRPVASVFPALVFIIFEPVEPTICAELLLCTNCWCWWCNDCPATLAIGDWLAMVWPALCSGLPKLAGAGCWALLVEEVVVVVVVVVFVVWPQGFVKLSVEFERSDERSDFEGIAAWSDEGRNSLYQLTTVSVRSKSSILIWAIPMKFFLSILPKFPQTMAYIFSIARFARCDIVDVSLISFTILRLEIYRRRNISLIEHRSARWKYIQCAKNDWWFY